MHANSRNTIRRLVCVAIAAVTGVAAMTLHAAEIKVLASNGVKAALEELAPAFERASGNKLSIEFGLAAVLKRQIESGAAFDVAILTSAGIEDLAKQGKIDAATRASIARSGVGIGVRAGAPRPDIGTADALKRSLLAAKSVSWAKEGASGTYFVTVQNVLHGRPFPHDVAQGKSFAPNTIEQLRAMADVWHQAGDQGASVSSGSFVTEGMVVAPVSMRTLAAIAHGTGDTIESLDRRDVGKSFLCRRETVFLDLVRIHEGVVKVA